MKKISVVQRICPHYRLPFFHRLNSALKEADISFQLIYGKEKVGTVPKTVFIEEPWAKYCPNYYLNCFCEELIWQNIPSHYLNSDLIIIEQANRLLNNYPFLFTSKSKRKVAFWGHGMNMQTKGRRFREIFKNILINKVDWWFAYTDISGKVVRKSGFPNDYITVVNNSIDTEKLRNNLANVSKKQVKEIFDCYHINSPEYTCLYCGGLYPEKKLGFLLSSCERVHKILPDFSLLVVGDGPEKDKIKKAEVKFNWLHYVGPKFDSELAPFLCASKAILMPGLVGLVIIDSFVAGLPLFTTDNRIHSPEIAYLQHGINGVMTSFNIDEYSNAIISFLQGSWPDLRSGSLKSAKQYSLENMVNNFTGGIQKCLSI